MPWYSKYCAIYFLITCAIYHEIVAMPSGSSAHFNAKRVRGNLRGGYIRVTHGIDMSLYSVISVGAWVKFNASCCFKHTVFSTETCDGGCEGVSFGVGFNRQILYDIAARRDGPEFSLKDNWTYLYYSRRTNRFFTMQAVSNQLETIHRTDHQLWFLPSDEDYFTIGERFSGQIEDLKVWTRELSESEVIESARGDNVSADALLYHFDFDKGFEATYSAGVLDIGLWGDRKPKIAPITDFRQPTAPSGDNATVISGITTFNGNYVLYPNHTLTILHGGVLNVTGCFSPSGKLIVYDDDYAVLSSLDRERVLVHYACLNKSNGGFSSIELRNASCNLPRVKENKFSMVVNVNNTCETKWWVHLVIFVVIGAFVIGILVVLIFLFVPSLKETAFPVRFRVKDQSETITTQK